MNRYLIKISNKEAMEKIYSENKLYSEEAIVTPPQANHIWLIDFRLRGFNESVAHDIPCPICYDDKATLCRDVTVSIDPTLRRDSQTIHPYYSCQEIGWMIHIPLWKRIKISFRAFFAND